MDGGPPGHALVAVMILPWLEAQPEACWVRTRWGRDGYIAGALCGMKVSGRTILPAR